MRIAVSKAISGIVSTRRSRLNPPNLPLALASAARSAGGAAGGGVFSFQNVLNLLCELWRPFQQQFPEIANPIISQ
jgi:hypothetical protein